MKELQYRTNNTHNKNKVSHKGHDWRVTDEKTSVFSNSLENTGSALTFSSKQGLICNHIYTRQPPAQNHGQHTQQPREKPETHPNITRYNYFQEGRWFSENPLIHYQPTKLNE